MNEDFFNENKKPTFLTVLIVLTCISTVLGVISNVMNLTNSGEAADQIEKSLSIFETIQDDSEEMKYLMRDYKEYITISIEESFSINLTSLILYLTQGFGVLLMYNLKQNGFWIYLLCQIGFVLYILLFFSLDNYIASVYFFVNLIISAIFSILYYLNLKHLKY